MSQLALWYDVTTAAQLPEYLRKLGIDQVICDARHVAAEGNQRKISAPRLRKFRKNLNKDGLDLAAVTVGWVRADVLEPKDGRAARKTFLDNIKALGSAGVPVAQLFCSVQAAPEEAGLARQWEQLIAYCREVAATAEQAGVKVGVHGSQARGHLVTNLASFQKLFKAVPSNNFGVTLCLGCLRIHGSDPVKCIRALGDRLVFLHARDLIMHQDGSWTDVNLGEGQIDYPLVKRAVDKVGFAGPIQPEHLGHMSFEKGEEITMARAAGFLRGIFGPQPGAAR